MKTDELEYELAEWFGVRTHLIVPNVFWGFGLPYEADMVVVTRARYAWEVEIKVSRADLKADKRKRHQHSGTQFKRLYFAMPEDIYDPGLVPDRAGVILARREYGVIGFRLERAPKERKVEPLTDSEYRKLLELCAMRVWTLKRNLVEARRSRQLELPL